MYFSEDDLATLLHEQRAHDEKSHRDVYYLGSAARLSHLVHHFFKYTGRLACAAGDRATLERTIVDTFIVALSACELLRISAQQALVARTRDKPSEKLALGSISLAEADGSIGEWLFRVLAYEGGLCAKAIESLDHLEAFDYRSHLEQSVARILNACIAAASAANMDLGVAVRRRWRELERRDPLG